MLNDGSRPWIDLPEMTRSAQAEERARERPRALTERARLRDMTATDFGIAGRTDEPTALIGSETCDAWYERFAKCRAKEVGSADDDHWRWAKWISPSLGAKTIRDVTPDDIEDLRNALTAAVLAYERAGAVKGDGRLAPKTSRNVTHDRNEVREHAPRPPRASCSRAQREPLPRNSTAPRRCVEAPSVVSPRRDLRRARLR